MIMPSLMIKNYENRQVQISMMLYLKIIYEAQDINFFQLLLFLLVLLVFIIMELYKGISIAHETIDMIMDQFSDKVFEKNSNRVVTRKVAKQILKTKQMSMQQINYQSLNNSQQQFIEQSVLPSKIKQHTRPFSATVKGFIYKKNAQKQIKDKRNATLLSRYSKQSTRHWKLKPKVKERDSNTSNFSNRSNRNYNANNETQKFFPLELQNQIEQQYVQQLRRKKIQQQLQQKKKQQFFQTIQSDAKIFVKSQNKFMSQYGQKNFIYTYKGEILQINKKKPNLKKGSTSRIVFQQESVTKSRPQTAQQILVVCRGSEQKTPTSRKTVLLQLDDNIQELFKTSPAAKITIHR